MSASERNAGIAKYMTLFGFMSTRSKSFEQTRACRSLICRVVSLWSLTAFIATHLGSELVEGHGAEHWYSLAEHLERHPDRALAALASDPRITLGLKLGDGAIVCHWQITGP
jgi:hypothetical protein